MDDTELDVLLARVRQSAPAVAPDPATVWMNVESVRRKAARSRRLAWTASGIAAAGILGVGLGRLTAPNNATPPGDQAISVPASLPSPEEMQLSLLAESSATLFAAVVQREPTRNDSAWTASVATLLWSTRQLLGTSALDASRQAVLEDLELVLVQLLGSSATSDPFEMELARQAIERRDLLPRLGALRVVTVSVNLPSGQST